jgi:hypothetical protein
MNNNLSRHSNTSQYIFVFFILLSLIFSACLSIKPSTTKSGKNYFETFYVGEEGTQYFIKPILFKDEKLNEDFILDITFRYKNEIKDSATVNFSINSVSIYKTIDSLKLSNKDIKVKSEQVARLFSEKSNSGFTSRYSTKFSLNEIKEMFNNDGWEMIIYNQNKITRYKPHRNTSRAIKAIRDRVFVLM